MIEETQIRGKYDRKLQVSIGDHGVILKVDDQEIGKREEVYVYKEEWCEIVKWAEKVLGDETKKIW